MKNKSYSFSAFIASMLIFGTIGIFRRFLPLSSGFLAFSRGIIGSCFLFLVAVFNHKAIFRSPGRRTLLLLLLSGALIGLNWVLLFEAYNRTTVAAATLCYYMEPTIVTLLSPLFLKEKLTVKKLLCALAAVIGMLFVSGLMESGSGSPKGYAGILLGLGASVLYSSVVLLNKRIGIAEAYQKTIIQLLTAALVLLPYLFFSKSFPSVALSPVSLVLLLAVGILHTGVAYALYFGSMDGLQAQTIAILSYLDPVFALLLSFLLLQEPMTVLGLVGAFLILGATLVSELNFPLRKSQK